MTHHVAVSAGDTLTVYKHDELLAEIERLREENLASAVVLTDREAEIEMLKGCLATMQRRAEKAIEPGSEEALRIAEMIHPDHCFTVAKLRGEG